MVPGLIGTADQYHRLQLILASRGIRSIAVTPPSVHDFYSFVYCLDGFLMQIGIFHVHVLGAGLGGFLAQVFAAVRPRAVESLILCNSFMNTSEFRNSAACLDFIRVTPGFLLKRAVLKRFPKTGHEESVEFMVGELENMRQEDLAARLVLHTTEYRGSETVVLSPDRVSIIDSDDDDTVPPSVAEGVRERWKGAAIGVIKRGGPWPFLDVADEFAVYVQLHVQRMTSPDPNQFTVESDSEVPQ
jgi:pimeloyl-ACP methyl ester carboxylesterase